MNDTIAVSDLVLGESMEFSRRWDSPAMLFLRRVHDLLQQAFGDLSGLGGHVRAGKDTTCNIHNEFCQAKRELHRWNLTHGEFWGVAVLMFWPSGGGPRQELELHSIDFYHRGTLAGKLSSFCRIVRKHDPELAAVLAGRFANQFDIPVEATLG